MKILLTGGGTAGSVSPLLAVAGQLRKEKMRKEKGGTVFLWLGTRMGPEVKMVKEYGIKFKPIFWGKMRRYFDLRNVVDFFKIKLAFWQAIFIILKFKPDIILSAGSFVSVPVIWAGWLLGKKSLIHQQDVRPGLANKLMALFATRITVTFEESLKHFSRKKAVWTGNPVREEILQGNSDRAVKRFGLERGVPVLLVTCGGTGSAVISKVVIDSMSELVKFCQIIHITAGKMLDVRCKMSDGKNKTSNIKHPTCNKRYHPVKFLNVNEMADAYAVADLVVSRGGLSSLTELSALGKPTIFIPLGETHQEDNAKYVLKKKAGLVIWERDLTVDTLIKLCKDILSDDKRGVVLSRNISQIMPSCGAEKIAKIIEGGGSDALGT